MRALLVTNMWPSGDRPDAGIFVADQADALRRQGIDLEVFSFGSGGPIPYAKGAFDLLRRRGGKYDVVHAHFGLSAWVSLAARGKVRAVTFHGTDLVHPRSRKVSLSALRFVDLPAAASLELAGLVPANLAPKGVEVLPCGVSLERARPGSRAEARARLGLDPAEPVILLPSDPTRPEKRADRAREIAALVGARLITLGGVPPGDVADRLNAADAVVIPSEREGFGIALLEALACNRPVFSTPTGIAPAALEGIEGTLCAEWDADGWARVVAEAIGRDTPIDGRERAAQWSTDACAAAVVDAWQRALSGV